MRNAALRLVDSDYIAFLDDDNSWTSSHLSRLLSLEGGNSSPAAIHSWRTLRRPDGTKFRPQTFPWTTDPTLARAQFDLLVREQVMKPGRALVADRSVLSNGQVGMVDMGEWLLPRTLMRGFRFRGPSTPEEVALGKGEDDFLLGWLLLNEVEIRCTRSATLNYTMGGTSNISL